MSKNLRLFVRLLLEATMFSDLLDRFRKPKRAAQQPSEFQLNIQAQLRAMSAEDMHVYLAWLESKGWYTEAGDLV